MSKFNVPEMSCSHCTAAIEKEIKDADNSAQVTCDLDNRTVSVESNLDTTTLLAAIKEAGYEASPKNRANQITP